MYARYCAILVSLGALRKRIRRFSTACSTNLNVSASLLYLYCGFFFFFESSVHGQEQLAYSCVEHCAAGQTYMPLMFVCYVKL